MKLLRDALYQRFPNETRLLPSIAPYWQYRHGLHEPEVILYNDRVVVPPSLRPSVLETLHYTRQGTSTMTSRTRSIVFWPGMTEQITLVSKLRVKIAILMHHHKLHFRRKLQHRHPLHSRRYLRTSSTVVVSTISLSVTVCLAGAMFFNHLQARRKTPRLKSSYLRGASSIVSHQHITCNLTVVLKLPLNRRNAFFDPTLDLWVRAIMQLFPSRRNTLTWSYSTY